MDLKLEFWQGGRAEFKQTGIYPQWLFFSSLELNQAWSIRFKKNIQMGCLKINGEVKFYYVFEENKCEIQAITLGSSSDWVEIEIIHVMCD